MSRKTIPYYKLAIELDPKFAVAYAALGVSYVNLAQPSAGADYISLPCPQVGGFPTANLVLALAHTAGCRP